MGICKNVKLASASIVKDEFGELYLRAEYTFETTDKDEKYRLVIPMIELPIPNNNLPNFRIRGDDDPEIDYNLNFTFNQAQKRTINAALSNTFGFGGHNACAIVKKFVK